jgi:phenylpyruvate tautomerase PptA (4-oxalocrotonate tautomerase family)
MPTHRIYTTSGLYSPAEKQSLASGITKIYTDFGLPAFYVVILFIDLPNDSYYVGGQVNTKFARFNIQHLSVALPNKEAKLQYMQDYEKVLRPFTADKGLDWEVS